MDAVAEYHAGGAFVGPGQFETWRTIVIVAKIKTRQKTPASAEKIKRVSTKRLQPESIITAPAAAGVNPLSSLPAPPLLRFGYIALGFEFFDPRLRGCQLLLQFGNLIRP